MLKDSGVLTTSWLAGDVNPVSVTVTPTRATLTLDNVMSVVVLLHSFLIVRSVLIYDRF